MAELRILRSDESEPAFKNWRARADAAMSDLFGPKHRVTLAFRDVTFASDFRQGRSRALSLLKSACSLAEAPPKAKTGKARPVAPAMSAKAAFAARERTAGADQAGAAEPADAAPESPTAAGLKVAVPEPPPAAAPESPTAAQPTNTTASEPVLDAPPEQETEPVEPKRETLVQRLARRRGFYGTHAAAAEEPSGVELESTTGAPVSDEPGAPPAADAVERSDAGPTSDSGAMPVVRPALSAVSEFQPPAPAPPRPGAPLEPKRETVARDSGAPRATQSRVREYVRPRLPQSDSEHLNESWMPLTKVWGADPPRSGPTVSSLTPRSPQMESPRPRRVLRRLMIAAALVVFLGLAVTYPVRAWWFEGWSLLIGQDAGTTTSTTTPPLDTSPLGPSATARVVDVSGDPRGTYILQVVRSGIVQLQPNAAGEVSFSPQKAVTRGEYLVWLDRVCRFPAGDALVPDTLYYDLDSPLRETAIDAYQRRIVLAWPDAETKIAFNPAGPILPRDAEAWTARLIVGSLPATALQTALGLTEGAALDLRTRISALGQHELSDVVEGLGLRPVAGWAKDESISRSEAAEFLMKLKATLETYPPA